MFIIYSSFIFFFIILFFPAFEMEWIYFLGFFFLGQFTQNVSVIIFCSFSLLFFSLFALNSVESTFKINLNLFGIMIKSHSISSGVSNFILALSSHKCFFSLVFSLQTFKRHKKEICILKPLSYTPISCYYTKSMYMAATWLWVILTFLYH